MKTVQKLSLLTLALTLASCNEKVSPELQQSNATTPETSPAVPPTEYYFRVTNEADQLLNYKVHKTGDGGYLKDCEIKNTSGFSNDIYRGNPVANDITCYYEGEELSFFNGGIKFAIEASKNTCDFVGYSAFGYYKKIPGDSSGSYTEVKCMNNQTNFSHVVAVDADLTYPGFDASVAGGSTLNCNQMASEDILPVNRNAFRPTSDAHLCYFNYVSEGGPRCDVGTITVNSWQITYTPATDTEPSSLKAEMVPREINCAGLITNCIDGPIKQERPKATRATVISQTSLNKPYTKSYTYAGKGDGTEGSNRYFVNFRRHLANPNIDFIDSFGLGGAYLSIWNDAIYGKTFDPRLMDNYANNYLMDGSTEIISTAALDAAQDASNTYRARPLAAEPYLGLEGNRINPFYTFYCLDTAMDVKARIRLMVREWDRVFPSNTSKLDYISDIWETTNKLQDVLPTDIEMPGDNDELNNFNDLPDWDDLIDMERTAGVPYAPASTTWSPKSGWFAPSIFPAD